MNTETLFLIDRANFKGWAVSTVDNGIVNYSGGQAVNEYLATHPEIIDPAILPWAEFEAIIKAFENEVYLLRPPVLITANMFDEMLNVLPPERWLHEGGMQTFRRTY